MEPIVFFIPIPPSANNLFATAGRKRVKTRAYRAWLKEAGWMVMAAGVQARFAEPGVRLLIEADLPRNRDCDNAVKPVQDLLVGLGILADDNLVDDVQVIRQGEKDRCRITLWA